MRRGGDTSTERCKNYYGEEGYCDLGDRCEYRHGEDAVVVFSSADLERWEMEEERAVQCAKERHELGVSKFKALAFHTAYLNYDGAHRPSRSEGTAYPSRPNQPSQGVPKAIHSQAALSMSDRFNAVLRQNHATPQTGEAKATGGQPESIGSSKGVVEGGVSNTVQSKAEAGRQPSTSAAEHYDQILRDAQSSQGSAEADKKENTNDPPEFVPMVAEMEGSSESRSESGSESESEADVQMEVDKASNAAKAMDSMEAQNTDDMQVEMVETNSRKCTPAVRSHFRRELDRESQPATSNLKSTLTFALETTGSLSTPSEPTHPFSTTPKAADSSLSNASKPKDSSSTGLKPTDLAPTASNPIESVSTASNPIESVSTASNPIESVSTASKPIDPASTTSKPMSLAPAVSKPIDSTSAVSKPTDPSPITEPTEISPITTSSAKDTSTPADEVLTYAMKPQEKSPMSSILKEASLVDTTVEPIQEKEGKQVVDSETGLPQGVRIDKSGKVKPVVDLRKQCPIPWKTRQAMAERFATFLEENGVSVIEACARAVELEGALIDGSPSPLDYRSCAASRFRKLRNEYSKG